MVAVKIIDLEEFSDRSIDEIRKEIAIMSQCHNKNVVEYYVSFIEGTELWLVMPYMNAGSVSDILNNYFPEGIKDEACLATMIAEVMKGL